MRAGTEIGPVCEIFMIKISYVWHDCFVVETDVANIVFDYWLDSAGSSSDMPAEVARLDRSKPLYVLVSHGHKDHYNPAIFSWASQFESVRYVVSADVFRRMRHIVSATSVYSGPKVSADIVATLRHGESASFGGVTVMAFPSTDIGNSYMLDVCGVRIFHAGDLNAWIWKDESTEQEIRKAMGDYMACLRDIGQACGERIDYAFFPVDSRIGTDYFTGAREFVRRFDVGHFFPMHFALGDAGERQRRRADALDFGLYASDARGEYVPLAIPGSLYINNDQQFRGI